MLLNALIERLHAVLGASATAGDPQSHLWDVTAPKGRFVICLTFEETTRKGSIWVFEPATGWSDTRYFNVADDDEVDHIFKLINLALGV